MKFTRRHDLDSQTRIEIVQHAWIHQGIYGKMTQIAQEYHISRTFLYQLSWAAKHHLEDLFSDPQHLVEPPDVLLEPWILLLRLEGKCSIPSLSSIFKHFDYQPNSVGYLSEYLRDYGPAGAFKQKGTVSLWKNAFATPSTYFLMCRTGFLAILQYSQN